MGYKNKADKKAYGRKYYKEHKKKEITRSKNYYKKIKKSKLSYAKDYRDLHPDVKRKSDYKLKFGLTLSDYNKMFEGQQGCCAICNTHQSKLKRSLAIDHNHLTGEIRGLLCGSCNTALGLFKTDYGVELLDKAKKYLRCQKSKRLAENIFCLLCWDGPSRPDTLLRITNGKINQEMF